MRGQNIRANDTVLRVLYQINIQLFPHLPVYAKHQYLTNLDVTVHTSSASAPGAVLDTVPSAPIRFPNQFRWREADDHPTWHLLLSERHAIVLLAELLSLGLYS